ncbi:DNA-deoxyinosine glycosylase [Muribaculum intestinale]|uniref:DNA-deoxyinosine glycosylase n=1 Tax=Muribaculum intestinale TaxID=1796646 RepID=UPI0025A0DFD4|nr:DNA-deoxyinosine glycosylase [Muribaculum intestinale]
MADINRIIYLIDEYLESNRLNHVGPSEVAAYLAKNGALPSDGGKTLRKHLRDGKIPNAEQPGGKKQSWYIRHSNCKKTSLSTPAHTSETEVIMTKVPTSSVVTEGLAPIADSESEFLILGTLPGKVSLETQCYYANQGNQFWKIMSSLFDESIPLAYEDRLRFLEKHHIALWDVLKSAERISSLDSDIENLTINDILGFISKHPNIRVIGLNGDKASTYFRTYINIDELPKHISVVSLPSSSSTNTHFTLDAKIDRWETILKQ